MKTKLIKLGLYSNNLIILKNIYQKIHYVILIIFHRLQHLYENRMELYNSYLCMKNLYFSRYFNTHKTYTKDKEDINNRVLLPPFLQTFKYFQIE